MATTISPNMNLPIPVVGQEPGPDYASDINSSLTILDGHTHTAGSGVPITPDAINVNADLPMNNNSITDAEAITFNAQGSPSSTNGSLSESGVDLYYTDGSGNQIRITQSGAIAGTPGSISGLTPPATAAYNSGSSTFIWQSAANTSASMDNGPVTIREVAVNAKGVTLTPVTSLASDYTLTLPQPPASQKIMTLDASGNMTAPYVVDNSTIEVSSNTIQVKNVGITTGKIADQAVTTAKIADLNVTVGKLALASITTAQVSATAGITPTQLASSVFAVSSTITYSGSSGSFITVTNATVTIAGHSSRPIFINFLGNNANLGQSYIGYSSAASPSVTFRIKRDDGTLIYSGGILATLSTGSVATNRQLPGSLNCVDLAPQNGNNTYTLEFAQSGTGTVEVNNVVMTAVTF